MSYGPIRITAPAKINLYLAVGATRPDGYHDVTTVLQALEFGDELLMRPSSSLDLICDQDLGIPAEENLAYRAALLFGEAADRSPDVAISIAKRVPHGAGLGGGSSDAAAVIAGLAYLWEIPLDDARVMRSAAALGADVPFFITGGTALFDGRGDRFVRALPTRDAVITLVQPPATVSTAAAYAAFDAHTRECVPGPRHVTDAIRFDEPDALGAALHNNMTDASAGLVPAIADALALCRSAPGVFGAAMCGSGSAVFAMCEDVGVGNELATAARERGWWSTVTRTSDRGVTVHQPEEDM